MSEPFRGIKCTFENIKNHRETQINQNNQRGQGNNYQKPSRQPKETNKENTIVRPMSAKVDMGLKVLCCLSCLFCLLCLFGLVCLFCLFCVFCVFCLFCVVCFVCCVCFGCFVCFVCFVWFVLFVLCVLFVLFGLSGVCVLCLAGWIATPSEWCLMYVWGCSS